jgi:hypothetical protein
MDSIYTEVRKFVQDRVDSGVVTRVDWLSTEYLESKGDVSGGDLEFYRTCALAHVSEVIKKVVGKYDSKPARAETEVLLPGFEHLQRAYTIKRDGVHLLVPVDQLRPEELLTRAAEYDDMAKGCRAHARELREYVSAREQASAA